MAPCKKCSTVAPTLKPTDEVYYSGEYLPRLGINTGDLLTGILVKIDAALAVVPGSSNDLVHAGVSTQTADGVQKAFSWNHNLGDQPSGVTVVATSNTNNQSFTTSWTLSQITVTYSIAPSQGDTISWSYIAVKNN